MYKSPAPIRAVVPQPQEIPPGLEAIVLKCLSKKVELRYQSMEELAVDLERVERGMVPEAVQEMMGRSGGFNVPADYFRKVQQPGGAGMLPATPSFRQKKPVLALVIAGASLFSFLVIAALVAIPLLAAPKRGGAGNGAAGADPSAASVASAGTTAPTGDGKIQVRIRLEPPDATVKDESGNVIPSPVKVRVGPTEQVTLTVEHKGYVTQTIEVKGEGLDAEDPWKVVTLVREKPAVAVAPVRGTGGKPPTPVKAVPASALPPPTVPAVKPPATNGPCPIGHTRVMGDCIKM
jgi:serine/threonine-protein kinase